MVCVCPRQQQRQAMMHGGGGVSRPAAAADDDAYGSGGGKPRSGRWAAAPSIGLSEGSGTSLASLAHAYADGRGDRI